MTGNNIDRIERLEALHRSVSGDITEMKTMDEDLPRWRFNPAGKRDLQRLIRSAYLERALVEDRIRSIKLSKRAGKE